MQGSVLSTGERTGNEMTKSPCPHWSSYSAGGMRGGWVNGWMGGWMTVLDHPKLLNSNSVPGNVKEWEEQWWGIALMHSLTPLFAKCLQHARHCAKLFTYNVSFYPHYAPWGGKPPQSRQEGWDQVTQVGLALKATLCVSSSLCR